MVSGSKYSDEPLIMDIAALNKLFSGKSVYRGPMLLLSAEDALDYIGQALRASINVIGLEGFHLLPGGAVQPDMQLELGLHHCQDKAELRTRITGLLNSWRNDGTVAFEVYLEEQS